VAGDGCGHAGMGLGGHKYLVTKERARWCEEAYHVGARRAGARRSGLGREAHRAGRGNGGRGCGCQRRHRGRG